MFCILQCAIAKYDSAYRYISVIYSSFLILGDLNTKTKLRSNLKETEKIFHQKSNILKVPQTARQF